MVLSTFWPLAFYLIGFLMLPFLLDTFGRTSGADPGFRQGRPLWKFCLGLLGVCMIMGISFVLLDQHRQGSRP